MFILSEVNFYYKCISQNSNIFLSSLPFGMATSANKATPLARKVDVKFSLRPSRVSSVNCTYNSAGISSNPDIAVLR